MPSGSVSAHLQITGRVQGVWYRVSAADEARRLGLTGWVRNVADGSVEAVAQGARDRVDAFVTWCEKGPPGALVASVSTDWLADTESFTDFEVRR